MLNPIKKLALVALASILAVSAQAFSLLGPYDYWEIGVLDYNGATTFYGGDIGAPQQISQQYRWSTPRIYYAYDGSFVGFFGAAGIKAMEQAIAVFNALPPVSLMSTNLTEFPLDSRKINLTAAALGILDLKSVAMAEIIEQLGLANSDRYTWTLRNRTLPGGAKCPNYQFSTTMRNFDPITWSPSAYVNNVLYSYVIESICPPAGDVSDALEQLVDPTAIGGSAVSDEASALAGVGTFYTGLSRDDAGGFRNILSKHQVAVQAFMFNSTNGTSVGGVPAFAGGVQTGSPWNFATTISPTNSIILGNNGSPWTIVFPSGGTNVTNGLTIPGVTITTTATNSSALLTAGVEKIKFINMPYDSTIGINFPAFADFYALTTYLNGSAVSTPVIRIIPGPDIVFASGDIGPVGQGNGPGLGLISRAGSSAFHFVNATGRNLVNGPGIINPPGTNTITFSSVGPFTINAAIVTTLNGGSTFNSSLFNFWGSFDGSTNPPIVYPDGLSIQQIDGQLFP